MKVCEICGDEISTKDGDNRCENCEELDAQPVDEPTKRKRAKVNRARRARADVMQSLGLVKVRGSMGGVYWE